MPKKLLMGALVFLSGAASALGGPVSPLNTVLRPARSEAQVASQDIAAMVKGFARCAPAEALPVGILSPLGVKFLERRQAAALRFAYGNLMMDRSVLVLVGNDPVNTEVSEGAYLAYGGKYRLKQVVNLGGVKVRFVASMVSVIPPKAVVGVTYGFNTPVADAIAALERHGVAVAKGLEKPPSPETARSGDVWFTAGDDGKSLSCWHYLG